MCELLLEYEADVDHVDRSGRTPLLAAASMGHAAVVERLLFWGCYVDHIDAEGRTVLSVAAAQGSQVRAPSHGRRPWPGRRGFCLLFLAPGVRVDRR